MVPNTQHAEEIPKF